MNPPHFFIDEKNILDNHTRGTLYNIIMGNPGTTLLELRVWLSVPHTTLQYHLQLLEEFELISTRWDSKHVYYYVAGTKIPSIRFKLSESQSAILAAAEENPGISQGDLAGETGFVASTVSYHLRKLVEWGLARTEKDGGKNKVYAVEKMQNKG